MPDDITIRDDGTVEAAFSLYPAWHGLGVVFDHPMTSKEAFEAAHLDWRVVQKPITICDKNADGTTNYTELDNVLANIREDTGRFLGIVTTRYKVVQNIEAFEFLDSLIEEGVMEYESAFSLSGGAKVCVLARMPNIDEVTQDDTLKRYILLSLHHDGTGSIFFGPTSVRVVCSNTYRIALTQAREEGTLSELSIRHTGNIKEKLQRAKEILALSNKRFDDYVSKSRELAKYRLSDKEWEEFLDVICPPINPLDPDYTVRRANSIERVRNSITEAFHNERQNLSGISHSAWAAFCAVVEHVDHVPRRGATPQEKAEARFNTVMYGLGKNLKERAFKTVCKLAGVS